MLVSMTVQNIALIENLTIDFHSGMQVLSGETGAGKSIIVDSINLILGERADRGLIRSGCEKASVEAVVDLSASPAARQMLKEQELEDENGYITIQREISTGDRNVCRICGSVVSLAYLRRLTEALVDVHGQHDHQSLLDSKKHMAFLDSFGSEPFLKLKSETEEAYRQWRESSTKYASLRKENARREERTEYLKSRLRELEELHPEEGESERLSAEKQRLSGTEKINAALKAAYHAYSDPNGVLDQFRAAISGLRALEGVSPEYKALSDRVSTAYYEAEEMEAELRQQLAENPFDAEQNEAILDRLDAIRRAEKHFGIPADELVLRYSDMKQELARLDGIEDQMKLAEAEFKKTLNTYREKAAELSQARRQLAEEFQKNMESQLQELGMKNTRFRCEFEQPAEGKKRIPTAEGDDQIVFYIAPNPGEPLKPLDKTASGGELSRVMLAMKACGAEHGGIPCMIFDEIDTGISGHTAEVVAQKMAQIAQYHQVLCVTHLAQIAAMADSQYLVKKQVVGDRTMTNVTPLDEQGRVDEIARLIGVTQAQQESGMAHAKALLASSSDWKKEMRAKLSHSPAPALF